MLNFRRLSVVKAFYLIIVLLVNLLLVAPIFSGVQGEAAEERVASAVSVQGSVHVRRAGKIKWVDVELHDVFYYGDTIRVLGKSRAALVLSNESILRLDENTTLTFVRQSPQKSSLLDLIKGIVHFISRVPRTLEVETPYVNAAVEGTEFVVAVEKGQCIITVFEGYVKAENKAGSLTITSGETAIAKANKAPVLYVVVHPRDAVQWALYYPPILYYRVTDFPGPSEKDWKAMVRKSIAFYRKGDIKNAFLRIKDVPEEVRDIRFLTYRAGLLLSVGRFNEAEKDLERVLMIDPEDSHALALKSIIAVTQNDKERAARFAEKAVKNDPSSAAALIALSYVQQVGFELEKALSSVKQAVEVEPENSLARARLAELWLSYGDLGKSLEAAQKAVSLDPDLARTQTVLGFAYLAKVRIDESQESFMKAIALDQADPLQRLGLGLAKIRKGRLRDGRREIEIATSLDPNRSLIRSYLGKAYYEEKRNRLASDQFDMAKDLDPFDPTSYFYDAIQKQTTNRPGEALYDIQKSIELNDNRAVYRSRLLLDEDLAARSASRARIYEDLGFKQLALIDGWNSVNTDPTSYSAHRYLSDNYAALPRHEVARVSELLQSQLLQPVNITPIQPRLAESTPNILSGAGPGDPSFNEYNPLFNRNRIALQASAVAGGDETLGDEVVLSGIYNKASLSAGQFHYETAGFRENNDQEIDTYNFYAQGQISYNTNIQAEYRANLSEKGDLLLRFFDTLHTIFPERRFKKRTDSLRFGFHHAFTPDSDVIGNFNYMDFDSDDDLTKNFTKEIDSNAYIGEAQYLFRSEIFHATSGFGHFSADPDGRIKISSTNSRVIEIKEDTDIRHSNLYSYFLINYPDNVIFTLGASADFFDEEVKRRGLEEQDNDRDQFNPKFGVTWNPVSSTTIRAAVFRGLKRTLVADQTIEPTQVAGFNQFFDDSNSTEFWRYGIGIDQKFMLNLYSGIEVSERDLEVPIQEIPSFNFERADWEETLARAYLYWIPHPWVALSTELLFEKFDKMPDDTRVETYRLPFGARFFHPCGLIMTTKATHFDQEVKLNGPEGIFRDDDRFWVVDASIGYRLPKRYGIITFEALNLFDREFHYEDTDPDSPVVYPDSLFLVKFTLSF
jgi:tetratricopeptide (TPR) repeat protein